MSRQNLGVMVVVVAVVLALVVALFVVPVVQPQRLTQQTRLDEVTERAVRRLHLLERTTGPAVAVDRAKLTLPEDILKPDAEAIQRSLANNLALISDSAGKISSQFRTLLSDHDQRYEAITGRRPSEGDRGELIQVPVGESSQVNWVKQVLARGDDPSTTVLKDLDAAISDLQQGIASVSLDDYRGTDHFRANWVLGSLQYQKGVLLANLAANHRAKADLVRGRLTDQYRGYSDTAARAKAIESRLAAITPATPTAAAQAPKVAPPPDAVQAAVDAAAPAPMVSTEEAAAAGGEEQPSAAGLLSRVGSLLHAAEAETAAPESPSPAAEPAGESTSASEPARPLEVSLVATEDPAVLAGRYEKEIDEQIIAAQMALAELQQRIVEPQRQLEQANEQLASLQQELTALEQAGYDVTSLESFDAYKKSYNDLTARIRGVEAAVQALQDGTMAGAQVDPATADDLTRATYTGGQPQVGLTVLNRRLAGRQKTLELLEAARGQMRDLRGSLQRQKATLDEALEQARAQAGRQGEQLAGTYGQFEAELAAAAGREDAAMQACSAAVQAYNTALQAARKQASDASNELSLANPAPDKRNERLEQLRDYESPQAASESGLVSACMLMAQIQLQRAVNLQGSRSLVAAIQAAGIETKLADMHKSIDESLDGALLALSTPDSQSDALRHAENYTRLIGKEKYAWLGAASRGLVYNLLAQAQQAKGQPQQASEARAKAVEALSEATRGNENSELLQPYTNLLASLRQGGR